MSDAGIIAAVGATGLTVLSAACGAVFSSYTRRRDDKDRRTGERIGKLESHADYERGRRAAAREGRGRNGE